MIDAAAQSHVPVQPDPKGGPVVGGTLRSAGDLIAMVWRRRLLLGSTSALAALLIAAAASTLTPRYSATSQIYLDPRSLQVVRNDITSNPIDATAFTNLVESQALLVLSDKVVRPVVNAERLFADKEFAGPWVTTGGDETAEAIIALDAARENSSFSL